MRPGPIFYIVKKEFHQVFRDPAMIRMIFIIPIVQLFVLAYAVGADLKNVRLSVLDQDHSADSRSLIAAFFASDLFIPAPAAENHNDLDRLLVDGDADMTLWIPRGYAEDIAQGKTTGIGIAVNGSNASLAGQGGGYAGALVRQEAERLMQDMMAKNSLISLKRRTIQPVTRYFFNPELKSQMFMVPAITVLLVTIISTMLTGMAVVREKEIGTLEQLMVSPITPTQLILGKTIPFAVLAYFELSFATTVAAFWFDLPLEGPLWLLAVGMLLYLLVTLGIGLFASTVSHTQQQAMLTIWFFMMFGIMMSGFFYPIANMPEWAQALTYVNPLRYVIEIVRGVFLKGSRFSDLIPQLIPLAILGVVIFGGAVLRFKKTLS